MRQIRLGAVGQLRDLVRKTPLPPMEMAVLLALVEHVNHGRAQRGDYVVWPSVRTLATETGLSRRSVERSLTALVGRSLIVLVKKSTYHEPDRYDVGMRTIAKLALTTADPAAAQKAARATVATARAAGAEQKRRVRADQKRRHAEYVAQTRPVDGPVSAEETRPVDRQTRPEDRQTRPEDRTDTSSGRLNPEGNPERTLKEPARGFSDSEVGGPREDVRGYGGARQRTAGRDLKGEQVRNVTAAPKGDCVCRHDYYLHRTRLDPVVAKGLRPEGECGLVGCGCDHFARPASESPNPPDDVATNPVFVDLAPESLRARERLLQIWLS